MRGTEQVRDIAWGGSIGWEEYIGVTNRCNMGQGWHMQGSMDVKGGVVQENHVVSVEHAVQVKKGAWGMQQLLNEDFLYGEISSPSLIYD